LVEKTDVLIIGGGPAGLLTAIFSKRYYPDKRVVLIRREKTVLVPCAIPYIPNTLGSVDKNIIPDQLLEKEGVEIVIDKVIKVNREERKVFTAKGSEWVYDKLVLATGSEPVKLSVPGSDLGNIFYIHRNKEYMEKLKNAIDEANDVVIVGGGFIGVELADEIAKMGKHVTIVELLPHCMMRNFDLEFCEIAETELRKLGVNIMTGVRTTAFEGDNKVKAVSISDGRKIDADVVVVSIGMKPNVELAKQMGLKIGESGGIVVDEYMRTSDPNIFAVGDCAEKIDFFTRRPVAMMLASIATAEARVAGANLYELNVVKRIAGTIGIFSTVVGDVCFGVAGLTEAEAKKNGFEVVIGEAITRDKHPGTMPGARDIRVKLVFSRHGGYLIGGQVAGGPSIGEIINLLGLAIQDNLTAIELATMQYGTHPKLTAAPLVYPVVVAAENALRKIG